MSRLNAAGTAWQQVVGGASPINQANNQDGVEPSLTAIGGVPYVAWSEDDGTNSELRVSRLNAAGTAWEQVVGGASPINQAERSGRVRAEPDGDRRRPLRRLERGRRHQRRAAGEPAGARVTSQSAVASATGATLTASVHTYGIPYPVGFQYGPRSASETAVDPAPAGSDNVTVTRQVGGLSPSTGYAFRPFATAGVPAPRVLGAIDAFTTLAATRAAKRDAARLRQQDAS